MELHHALFVVGRFILLLLLADALCHASGDGNADDGAAVKDSEGKGSKFHGVDLKRLRSSRCYGCKMEGNMMGEMDLEYTFAMCRHSGSLP